MKIINRKQEKLLLVTTFCLLVTSNLYWLINEYRLNKKDKYEATYDCETKELIFSLRTFPIGITYKEFKDLASLSKLKFSKVWEVREKYTLEISDIFDKCPISGRPYCGIIYEFESDKLIKISRGYPCH